jgi:FtsZ-interacting cell division protein ZipA
MKLADIPLPALILILCTVTVLVQIVVEKIYAKTRKSKTIDDYGATDRIQEPEDRGRVEIAARPIRIEANRYPNNRGAGQRKKKFKNHNRGRRK